MITTLQKACADMAQLQTLTSGLAIDRILVEQAAARSGKPVVDHSLRVGAALAAQQLGLYSAHFARVVTHRAAANDDALAPEFA